MDDPKRTVDYGKLLALSEHPHWPEYEFFLEQARLDKIKLLILARPDELEAAQAKVQAIEEIARSLKQKVAEFKDKQKQISLGGSERRQVATL